MDVARAVVETSRATEQQGFRKGQVSMVATAVSELARNILRYAGRGVVSIEPIEAEGRKGVEIIASDEGPGIEDVEAALQDHFSTGGTLGLGLPGVRRLMDEFHLESAPDKGTRVRVRKWAR